MNEIKKNWDDVTIGMWQELSQIESDSPITQMIEQISILADMDSAEIRAMSMTEFRKFQESIDFIQKAPTAEVELKFEIDGKKYGMIPQLDFISTGEWMDAESWKEDAVGNIHLYAALLYRPIIKEDGEVYEVEPHKSSGFLERANLFRDRLSINVINGAVLFFSSSAIAFTKILADYLAESVTEAQSLMKTTQTQTHTKKQKPQHSNEIGDSTIN
jgi:hypothetical protein